MVIVLASVPHAFVAVRTNIFVPFTNVTLFSYWLVAALKLPEESTKLFWETVMFCVLTAFCISALKVKLADLTVVPFALGFVSVIVGGIQV